MPVAEVVGQLVVTAVDLQTKLVNLMAEVEDLQDQLWQEKDEDERRTHG